MLYNEKEIKKLTRLNNRKTVMKLSTLITIQLICIISIVHGNWIIQALSVLLIGIIMSGFFSAIHYGTHNTLFTYKIWNLRVSQVLGTIIFLNSNMYKFFHYEHHKNTNKSGDTEPTGEIRSIWHYLFYCLNWDFIYAFKKNGVQYI